MVRLLNLKDEEGSTCSFSSNSSAGDEMLREEDLRCKTLSTAGNSSECSTSLDPMNLESAGGVEVQAVGKKGKHLGHQMTTSHPYQIFVIGGKRWWRRRSTKFWVILGCFLVLLILTIAIPARKRTTQSRNPTKISAVTEGSGLSGTEQLSTTESGTTNTGGTNPTTSASGSNPSTVDWTPLETDVTSVQDIVVVEEDLTSTVFGPLSTVDPTVYFPNIVRPADSSPSSRLGSLQGTTAAIPTNSWYQNLLLLRDGEVPSSNHQAYTVPYIVDVAGPIPGLRLHSGTVDTSADQVIISVDQSAALTLGAAVSLSTTSSLDTSADKGYNVMAATELGVTLQWNFVTMKSSVVRGMPYATMIYPDASTTINSSGARLLPTIYGERRTSAPILIDGGALAASCGSTLDATSDLELSFVSGYTWLVYFSQPVTLQCSETDTSFALQVLNEAGALTVRLAVVPPGQDTFKAILRQHATVYPGENTFMSYEHGVDQAGIVMNWDPQPLTTKDGTELITFAMPHHQDRLEVGNYCVPILLGQACLVKGNTWKLVERLPPIDFVAPRLPDSTMLPDLVEAVNNDLSYRVPQNFLLGAGDTYFSGKALGKLARILIIAEQVTQLCSSARRLRSLQSSSSCGLVTLPDSTAVAAALDHLRQAVEVWLMGAAQAPLLYDSAWGGVVSCGCYYASGTCSNVYPNCPGLTDQGLNFGAGFYNDHHFHYGYHIYAAAVLAHFDPDWGMANFERVVVLIRDIANPSPEDPFFPLARHKDWYHGSSWASGISQPVSPTGMNQESSSEAIAAYEAVALFGKTMAATFTDSTNQVIADNIYKMGRILTATELRSAKQYWQVSRTETNRPTFDSTYQHNVVGILWSSKVFFGTWFGNSPYLIYGIQLLPLTPISEERDDVTWASETFDTYAQSCDTTCVEEGWSVQILSLLATLGHKDKALGHAKNLTDAIFESPGGNGHSMSNTIWYIATRPDVSTPFTLPRTYMWEAGLPEVTCFLPDTCTDTVLGAMAGEFDCRSRITYLMKQGISEYDACFQIAVTEYPDVCGSCNPSGAVVAEALVVDQFASPVSAVERITCNQPSTCSSAVLQALAGPFSCGDRIDWLMATEGLSETQACRIVAVNEFPDVCGGCNPN